MVQERSERTRRKLVQAGAEMFHRNGYASATLGGIAAFAGVTKGALYFHFASKEELAEAVQLRGCALLDEAVRELRASGLRPLQTLVDTTHWLARNLREEPSIPAGFRITKECAGLREGVTDFHRFWLAAVCELLRQAREAGSSAPGPTGRASNRWWPRRPAESRHWPARECPTPSSNAGSPGCGRCCCRAWCPRARRRTTARGCREPSRCPAPRTIPRTPPWTPWGHRYRPGSPAAPGERVPPTAWRSLR